MIFYYIIGKFSQNFNPVLYWLTYFKSLPPQMKYVFVFEINNQYSSNPFWLKMLVFVKNRNKTEPLELVSWKSTNNLNQENEDFQVPLKATSITVVFLLLFCIFFIVIFISDNFWHSLATMVTVIGILPLPLLLIFTVKQSPKEIEIYSASKNSSVS